MSAPRAFDMQHYETLNTSRIAVVTDLLSHIKDSLDIQTAADIGCGVGDFSRFLSDCGLRVVGIDAREQNVAEARRRSPDITFRLENAEDLPTAALGTFDIVLSFGLLYHLENPFRTIRYLYSLTDKILLVEGMCVPGNKPAMELLDECVADDQGLSYVSFYPSEPCLTKMLYRSGFPFVYRLRHPPADIRFIGTRYRKRERTLLVASKVALDVPSLVLVQEPFRTATGPANPWDSRLAPFLSGKSIADLLGVRIPRFLRRPWAEKREIIAWYTRRYRHRS